MTYSWTPPGEYNSFLQYCRNLYGQDKSSLLLLFGDVPPGSRVGCPDPGGEGYSPIKVKGYSSHLLGFNKNRRKAIFNWAAKGLFFLRGGGGYTHSGYYKTLSPTIACDRISCETET